MCLHFGMDGMDPLSNVVVALWWKSLRACLRSHLLQVAGQGTYTHKPCKSPVRAHIYVHTHTNPAYKTRKASRRSGCYNCKFDKGWWCRSCCVCYDGIRHGNRLCWPHSDDTLWCSSVHQYDYFQECGRVVNFHYILEAVWCSPDQDHKSVEMATVRRYLTDWDAATTARQRSPKGDMFV